LPILATIFLFSSVKTYLFMPEAILSNRYKILKKLGEGGFGQTFLAEDLHLPTAPHCVVKRLKPEFADEESYKLARRLFEQEAEIMYRMGNHPNIPKLLAHFEENGEFFLAQELIEGWTLAEEFSSGKCYTEREAIDLLRQILETLAFVHSQNVIHRDIKPSNLIRRAVDGRIFLIDFGAVKQVSINPFNQNPTFQSTVAIGSHGYMPPEQTAGKPRFSSDLYAAGLVVVEALTGMNPLQLNQNRMTGEFLWQHKAKIHPEIGNLVSRLIRYDFRQRYMSAKEAFASLNMLASSLGLGRKNPIPVQPIISPVQAAPVPIAAIKPPEINAIPSTVAAIPNSQVTMPNAAQNNFQQHNFQPAPNVPKEDSKNFINSLWNNDVALGGVVVAVVFGFFFLLGYMVVRYAFAAGKAEPESTSVVSAPNFENPTSKLFEEAENQATEAGEKEKRATTKADWDEIGNQYKRAYTLLSSIDEKSPEFARAVERMSWYQQKSETAFGNGVNAYYNRTSYPNSNGSTYQPQANYPSSGYSSSSSSYPTATPAKSKPVVTMPPKKSYGTYLTYNYINYDRLETKTITTDDAIFTSTVEKQSSSNKRDSGAVKINIDGGSYSSARLAFKAPFGQKLGAVSVGSAQEYLWQSPTMYAVSFDKLNCYERANHSFTINSLIYDELYSSVAYIEASFTINCGTSKLMGRIRYDAR
jgi:serine/threonine protein kinase